MGEVSDNPIENPKRLRYDREAILAIKDRASTILPDVFDKHALDLATQRNFKGKSKTSAKSQDRSKDPRIIFLGPHKRTWNTGCHVAHSNERDVSDHSGRGGRTNPDYRSRHNAEYKQDFRGSTRDRGSGRRNDGVFSRLHTRDDRYRSRNSEEEPEWFSEGPTTVNDTIELGRVLEEEYDDHSVNKKHSARENDHSITPEPPTNQFKQAKENSSAAPIALPQLENRDNPPTPKVTEPQGSRFRHLFSKSDKDGDVESNKDAINDQLLKLLKGSINSPNPCPKNNVSQVENKLRSMLLGHNAPRTVDEKPRVENKNLKPQILTVEEIEAQLSLRPCSPTAESNSPASELPRSESSGIHTDSLTSQHRPNMTNYTNSQPNCASNLAPILQSFTLKQQATCPKPMPSPLNPFGMLSNPMAHLPTSANAVSASARINQLQHADLIPPPGLCAIGQQGTHAQLWENNPTSIDPMAMRHLSQNCYTNNSISQHPGGPGLLSDINFRSTLGLGTSNFSTNGLPGQRRPIVKVQQGLSATSSSQLSPLTPANSNQGSCGIGTGVTDVDRRLFNLAFRHQLQANGVSQFLPDKPLIGGVQQGPRGDMRFAAPNLQQFSNPPLHPLFTGNYGNTNLDTPPPSSKMHANRTNPNTLAFLSQLVEMDRFSKTSTSALNPLLASNVTAKTLDEIEHHEVTSSGSFF